MLIIYRYNIERLYSCYPGEQDNKEDGGHISVPDKAIGSNQNCFVLEHRCADCDVTCKRYIQG